jgi:Rap guanine nucleotide exchange factor 1
MSFFFSCSERDILEKTSQIPVRTSHSTESILRDSSPPPKPPLPINRYVFDVLSGSVRFSKDIDFNFRSTEPPPIPPKRKSQHSKNNSFHDQDLFSDSSFLGIDQMSLNSRSPDDNRSNWSDSAGSLDSALNHSREEEELRTLTLFDTNGEDSSMMSLSNDLGMNVQDCREDTDKYSTNQLYLTKFLSDKSMMHRNSSESGFGSARSSDPIVTAVNQQQQSSVFSIQQQQKLHITSTQTTTKTSNFQMNEPISLDNLASLHQISAMSSQNSSFSMNQNVMVREETKTNCQKNLSSLFMAQQTNVERTLASMATVSYDNVDDVFSGSNEMGAKEKPPALPVKQRPKSFKRGSHYDNVDEALLRLSPSGT